MKKLVKSLLKAIAVVAALFIVLAGLFWVSYQFESIDMIVFIIVLLIAIYTVIVYKVVKVMEIVIKDKLNLGNEVE